jgi:hypothetical protein
MSTTNRYNPFTTAAQAAFAELKSDRALEYYSLRAQADSQTVLDGAVWTIARFALTCQWVYRLGVQARAWVEAQGAPDQASVLALPPAQLQILEDYWAMEFEIPEPEVIDAEIVLAETPLYFPAPEIALLPAAIAPHPDRTRIERQCLKEVAQSLANIGIWDRGEFPIIPPAVIAPESPTPKRKRGGRRKAVATA